MAVTNEQAIAAKTGLMGFVVGTAFGAILGVLYAPREGEETRRLIREQAGKAGDRARETVSDAQLALTQKANEIGESAKSLTEEVKKIGNYREREMTIEELEQRVAELEEQLKAKPKSK